MYCCGSVDAKPQVNSLFTPSPDVKTIVDTVCRIALTVICLVIAPKVLLISVSVGLLGGLCYGFVASRYKEMQLPNGDTMPVCAWGNIDFLSGFRFPPIVGIVAATAFLAVHIRHDPVFFGSFTGGFLGFGLGYRAARAIYTGPN